MSPWDITLERQRRQSFLAKMNGKMSRIYLDYNATTPLAPEAQEAIIGAMKDAWGNPSTSYEPGVKARRIIDNARSSVAFMVGAKSSDIIFTSGGTEGNNWILQMAVRYFHDNVTDDLSKGGNGEASKSIRPHFITSSVEHDSVKCVLEHFEKEGIADKTCVPVSKTSGKVEVEDIMAAVRPSTVMVTVMMANNESGVIQPIPEISEAVHRLNRQTCRRILIHTDAAQALGKIPVDVEDLGVDYLTIVGHKFYAPRIGAIYVRNPNKELPMYPMLFGGGQERNFRPGTENTPMVAGLGKAAELVHKNLSQYTKHMTEVRDYLESKLAKEFGCDILVNGKCERSRRLPNTCNVSFKKEGLKGHKVLSLAERVQASTGAACHAQNKPSHILLAMGVPESLAWNAVRLSVGRETSKEDIDIVVKDLRQAVDKILSDV